MLTVLSHGLESIDLNYVKLICMKCMNTIVSVTKLPSSMVKNLKNNALTRKN